MERQSSFSAALGLLVLMTSCGQIVYPITSGSYKALPKGPVHVVVWGSHEEAVAAAARWLERRGLVIVEQAKVRQMMNEPLSDTDQRQHGVLLQTAKRLGASEAVLIETSSMLAPSYEPARAETSPYGTPRSVSVSIRALDTDTAEVLWEGTAFFPPTDRWYEEGMTKLVCQALATVWGFRPGGYHQLPSSDMCEVEDGEHDAPPTRSHLHLGAVPPQTLDQCPMT
jgi:hypothetical protein